jgi:hypothetical protein
MKTISAIVATACMGLTYNSAFVHAEDMAKVAPHNTKVLFENDRVRVLETRTKPGEKLAMHSHPPRVNYFLNPLQERITYAGKPAKDYSWKAGEVAFSEAVKLEVVNIGTTEGHNIVIELKGDGAGAEPLD